MAKVTAVRDDQHQTGDILAVALDAAKVYAGTLLTINSNGYAHDAATKEPVAGVAIETVDNSAGSAGDKDVRVYRTGVVIFDASGLTQADCGKAVYATDNHTVSTTGGTGTIPVGRIVRVESATSARVQLNVNGATA